MRAARRKGPASVADHPELSERIAGMRGAGMTLQAIADQLNADGIPTVRGGAKWRPSSVQAAAGYRRPPTGHALDLAPGDRKYPDRGGRGAYSSSTSLRKTRRRRSWLLPAKLTQGVESVKRRDLALKKHRRIVVA